VHNYYSDGGLTQLDTLTVEARASILFSATELIQSFAVPSGVGALWSVFDWDDTTIRPINTISEQPTAPPRHHRWLDHGGTGRDQEYPTPP
jgi:hypothetical protein